MAFKYKSTVQFRLGSTTAMSTSVHGFYGPGFDVPGYNMKPIIRANMIIITATFDFICITQSSLNLSY